MTKGIRFKSLAFHSPIHKPAIVNFGPGLNVVYGASNTGKSFIVESLDFMLGGKGPLSDIPERVGYDRILLGIETLAGEKFTLSRSVDGGAFKVFEGLHAENAPDGEGTPLADLHNEKREDNLSSFLLSKIDLTGKRIRKNKAGETQSLSFRNIARLMIINEEEIIQKRTPLSDGNPTADTANSSVFKLLTSGVDDSALTAAPKSAEEHGASAQIELLDQLINNYRDQIKDITGSREELEEQQEKLNGTMLSQESQLSISEQEFNQASSERRDVVKKIEERNNRLAEITILVERFTLLGAHYRSDIERLQAIEEAGNIFGALEQADCPLCGSRANHQNLTEECTGNVDLVVKAARSEIEKIEDRQTELSETLMKLKSEAASFERHLPRLQKTLANLSSKIETIVAPNLKQIRRSYKALADKSGEVREALAIYRNLKDLEGRRTSLDAQFEKGSGASIDSDLSTSTADAFSTVVKKLLEAWHFPNIGNVHFEMKLKDLVISGKPRISFGKGLRAVTQAAFTIGLMEFCRTHGLMHPGFVVLDSPLLSYKEPDGEEDDLRGTDLKDMFYELLSKAHEDRQIIIIENTDPPPEIQSSSQSVKFTGIVGQGRQGLFPTSAAEPSTDVPGEQ